MLWFLWFSPTQVYFYLRLGLDGRKGRSDLCFVEAQWNTLQFLAGREDTARRLVRPFSDGADRWQP